MKPTMYPIPPQPCEHDDVYPGCPACVREHNAIGPPDVVLRPRNRAERLALDAFLRRFPAMRVPDDL